MKRRSSIRQRIIQLSLHEKRLSSSGYKLIAGIDEAGRGPLAGPVVAGAVILRKFDFTERIDDSKRLTSKMRDRAYGEIIEKSIVGIGVVDEKAIDEINIYRATIRAMQLAIAALEIAPEYILVDGRMKLVTKCPIKCIVGGDAISLSIAAASIVAKVTRDRIMLEYHRQYPAYGFARHKGYATVNHKELLRIHGPSPIHRQSFRPVADCRI